MTKPGTIKTPGKIDMDVIQEQMRRDRAEGCVHYVMRQITNRMADHRLPHAVATAGSIWLPTNLWDIVSAKIVNDNTFELHVIMRWMLADGYTVNNPLGSEEGTPKRFGPGFKLPHELKMNIELTEMPSQGGRSTGHAPGVDKKYHAIAEKKILEALVKLPWFGGDVDAEKPNLESWDG
jgi:hypothetical protein